MRSHDRDEEARAREALTSLGPVAMSETERADIRRAVWSEITAARGSAAPSPTRVPWGWRVVGSAALLALVVGVAATLSGDGSEAGVDASVEALDAPQFAGENASPPTHETFAGGRVDESPNSGDTDGSKMPPVSGEPETEMVLRRHAEMLRAGVTMDYRTAEPQDSCPEVAALEGLVPVAIVEVEGDEFEAWVPEGATLEPGTPITFVDAESCAIAATE